MAWADLTDARCYYELLGTGEAVLLIPGLGGGCRADEVEAPILAKHFSLVCPELRGVGRSVSRRTPHSLRDFAADLVELLDHLQVERAHVMGLSLGGIVAQRLAVDHPDRVNRLVLISCAHRFGPFLREMTMLLGHTLRRFPPHLFRRTMELLGSSPLYMDADPGRIDQKVEEALARRHSMRAVAQQLRCLAASELAEEEYRITAPTLVLAGEYDALIPHCYVRRMAEAIAGSTFVLVEGAGHNPLAECPQRLLPTIVTFLQSGRVSPIPPLAQADPACDLPGVRSSPRAA